MFQSAGYRHISEHDMMLHPRYSDILGTLGLEEGTKRLLYELGIDTNKQVSKICCYHRSQITGSVHLGNYYFGTERQDKKFKMLLEQARYVVSPYTKL